MRREFREGAQTKSEDFGRRAEQRSRPTLPKVKKKKANPAQADGQGNQVRGRGVG